jgi:hypothetical protein
VGDLVNWFRELSVDSVKYRLFVDALEHHEAHRDARADSHGGLATA